MGLNDYYKTCPIPKPTDKKPKKKVNGWKNKKDRFCAYCGEPYAERHEVFGGPNRQTSINYGFQVDVCRMHHKELQNNFTDWAKAENKVLRSGFQRKFMDDLKKDGCTEKEALKAWMMIIGKNYLEECDPE